MKGITECLKWMLNNPMKELQNGTHQNRRYNDTLHRFEAENKEVFVEITNFSCFMVGDWLNSDSLYSYERAYNMCKLNRTTFVGAAGYKNQKMYRNRDSDSVYVKNVRSHESINLDCMWVKANENN